MSDDRTKRLAPDATRAEYKADPGINWSLLKHLQRSPEHYAYAVENDTKPRTDAMILGTVTHFATFEPAKLDTHVALWEGRRAGKKWEAFRAENELREIIKREPYDLALAMAAKARACAGKLLSEGQSEVALTWTHENGLPGKGRVDHISRGFGIIDLKTCRDASPVGFGRSAAGMGYHVQGAYYVDGAERAGWGRLPYTILAVESHPPHVAALYTLTPDHLELGHDVYAPLLDRLKECQAKNEWPGYAPQVLTLPLWASYDAAEDDLAELGLKFE